MTTTPDNLTAAKVGDLLVDQRLESQHERVDVPGVLDLRSAPEFLREVIDKGLPYFITITTTPLKDSELEGVSPEQVKADKTNPKRRIIAYDADQIADLVASTQWDHLLNRTVDIAVHIVSEQPDVGTGVNNSGGPSLRSKEATYTVNGEERHLVNKKIQTGLEADPEMKDLIDLATVPRSFKERLKPQGKHNRKFADKVTGWLNQNGVTVGPNSPIEEVCERVLAARHDQVAGFMLELNKMQVEHNEEVNLAHDRAVGERVAAQEEDVTSYLYVPKSMQE